MSDDSKFWLMWSGIVAAGILALVVVGVVVNGPDWKVEREMALECAKRGGVRLTVSAQSPWRAGCYSVKSLDAPVSP